jgi:hypothetical protein
MLVLQLTDASSENGCSSNAGSQFPIPWCSGNLTHSFEDNSMDVVEACESQGDFRTQLHDRTGGGVCSEKS